MSNISLEDLKKLADEKGQRVDDVNLLFLDLSSTCTGYSVYSVNFVNRSAKLSKAGAIWFDKDLAQDDKCAYIYNMMANYFNIVDKISYVVKEAYRINPKRLMGVLVSIELHGALKAGMSEVGIKHSDILPQSWRSVLGIKAVKDAAGKKDWKQPTKDYILTKVAVPEDMISNVTKNNRNTPSDVYDAIAIGMAFLTKVGIRHIDTSKVQYQAHVGHE